MHRTATRTRNSGLPLIATALIGLLVCPGAAQGQQRMMVVDNGEGPRVMHIGGPEMHKLRTPDFVRRDLPVFVERLRLDTEQSVMVSMLLDAYLEAFKALEQALPKSGPMAGPLMLGGDIHQVGGPGGGGGEGPGPDGPAMELAGIVGEVTGGDGEDVDVTFTAGGAMAIAVTARVGDAEEHAEAGGEPAESAWQAGGEGGPHIQLPGMEDGAFVHVEAGAPGEAMTAGVAIAVTGPDGQEIPKEVLERLQERAQALAERLRQQIEDAVAAGADPEEALGLPPENFENQRQAVEDFQDAAAKFRQAADQLREALLAQVRGELTSDQLPLWPGFERAIRRIKTLPLGRLDGERTDLFKVVETLAPGTAEREALAQELEAYEGSLDAALLARNDYLRETEPKLSEAVNNGKFDRAIHIAGEAARLRVAVRSVNEQYVEAISGKLSEDRGSEFRREALRRSFPRVYRPTAAQKAFAEAAKVEGLDPQVIASLEALRTSYESELAAANDRIREAIRREQPGQSKEALQHVESVMSGTAQAMEVPHADAVHEAFARRKDLGERYIAQIRSLLPPE